MVKNICRRFLSLSLAFLLAALLLPSVSLTSYAATEGTLTGLTDTNIGLRYGGTADDAWSASGRMITGKAMSTGGTCSTTHYETTLTITNNRPVAATLSFDYTIAQNDGTIQVAGTAVAASGSYTGELAAGDSVKVYIKSGSTSAYTRINITNISLIEDVTATVLFQPAENGSYTVDGRAITEDYTNTQSALTAYKVAATPAAGYQFTGWYDATAERYISTEASTSLHIERDCTVTAKFNKIGTALYDAGGQVFDDLNAAVSYAQTNGIAKITLIADGSLNGAYTIPAGITLLIPFDNAQTLYTTTPVSVQNSAGTQKAYRTLALAEDASLTVEGKVSVGGQYKAAAGSAPGFMTGAYGLIDMAAGSRIAVKDGGALYAWGFVTGSGNVTAESGASVYEWFQIADFRGGTATIGMGNRVFPFSQYFIQNIEVPLTIQAGASETVYTGIFASGTITSSAIEFIGDNGMFQVNSGSFTKAYDGGTDRMLYTVNGDMELNSLSLSLMGMSFDSSAYVLPIVNNITLNIDSGSTVAVNQDLALLAGTQVNVAETAQLTVSEGKNVYIYDQDEWTANNYVTGGKFKSVFYAPGKSYTRTAADLLDAKIDVNGTLEAAGSIYTTAGGADIVSSKGAGKFLQTAAPGSASVTYQYTQNGSDMTKHEIPITPAKLHNADGSYTETAGAAAGDTYVYQNGAWGKAGLNGWQADENGKTFLENGQKKYFDQWADIEGDTYYFNSEGYVVTGLYKTTSRDGSFTATFIFDGDGVFQATQNGLYDVGPATYWSEAGRIVEYPGLIRVVKDDGEINYYYFGKDNKAFKATEAGSLCLLEKTNGLRLPQQQFQFDETGVILHDPDTSKDGWVREDDGNTYNYIDGIPVYLGLIEKDGDYYYIKSNGMVVMNRDYEITRTNGLLPAGRYHFDETGRMVLKSGIVEEDGSLYYYEKGQRVYAGLIQIDGDYYYVRSTGEVVNGRSYWITKTNALLPEGSYVFSADGKMVLESEKPSGIVEESGSLYYYEDGNRVYAGLIQIDGGYYYVRSTGEVVHGRSYWITETNGLLAEDSYTFAADGKMVR